MIPKKIHYCWFGGNPLPEDARKCIASWKKYLPDYEIKEWNETNFDIDSNLYVRQAYEARKFAFVTDYVRLYALATEGGVYMDTDVEVLKSYDPFLHHVAFSGFESSNYVGTAVMASEPEGRWIMDLLKEYENREFVRANGKYNTTTNVEHVTAYLMKKGLKLNNLYQEVASMVAIYPSDYFCPKDHGTGLIKLTENSVCIHHFACSWISNYQKLRHKLKFILVKFVSPKVFDFVLRGKTVH